MSFTYNFTQVEQYDVLHEDDAEYGVSCALAWSTLVTGMNRITEANVEEFTDRYNVAVKAFGPFYTLPGRDVTVMTYADVRRRVGMWTNASPRTAAKFNAHIISELRRDARVAAKNAERARAAMSGA